VLILLKNVGYDVKEGDQMKEWLGDMVKWRGKGYCFDLVGIRTAGDIYTCFA
jgi:hypothetical protein